MVRTSIPARHVRARRDVHAVRFARFELTCLYCGHDCGDVALRATDRPSYSDLRHAIAEAAPSLAPTWDAHGAPRCPRCRAKLFIAKGERRPYTSLA